MENVVESPEVFSAGAEGRVICYAASEELGGRHFTCAGRGTVGINHGLDVERNGEGVARHLLVIVV